MKLVRVDCEGVDYTFCYFEIYDYGWNIYLFLGLDKMPEEVKGKIPQYLIKFHDRVYTFADIYTESYSHSELVKELGTVLEQDLDTITLDTELIRKLSNERVVSDVMIEIVKTHAAVVNLVDYLIKASKFLGKDFDTPIGELVEARDWINSSIREIYKIEKPEL